VAKALADAMTPFWEPRFLDGSHGFRPKRSHLTMLASLARTIECEGRWVIVEDDIKGAFNHVRIPEVIDDHRAVLPKELCDKLLVPVITGIDPNYALALRQGCPYSPTALNVCLTRALDRWWAHPLGDNPGTL